MSLRIMPYKDIATGEDAYIITDPNAKSGMRTVISADMPVLLSTYANDLDVMAEIFGVDWRKNNVARLAYQILLIPLPMGTSIGAVKDLADCFAEDAEFAACNPNLAEFYKFSFGLADSDDLKDIAADELVIENNELNKAILNELYHHNCPQLKNSYSLCEGRIGDEIRSELNLINSDTLYTSNNLCGVVELNSGKKIVRIGNTLVEEPCSCSCKLPCKGCGICSGLVSSKFQVKCSRLFRGRLFYSDDIECCLNELIILMRRRDIINCVPEYEIMRFISMCASGQDCVAGMPSLSFVGAMITQNNCKWAENVIKGVDV